MQLFLDAFVLALLVLIHLYRPGENLWCHDVTHVKLQLVQDKGHIF